MALKATYVLKQNIDALLSARGYKRKDLAVWCHRTKSWLSQIMSKPDRNIPIEYLDRISAFFGLETYQLFQPGIARTTERRAGTDRRVGQERRLRYVVEILAPAPSVAELEALIRRLDPEAYRKFARRAVSALTLGELPPDAKVPRDLPVADAPLKRREKRSRGG